MNPGFHDVSKRILSNLDDDSLVILSQTIKGISKKCEPILMKRGQKRLVDNELHEKKNINYPWKNLICFMKKNQIFHEGYFKFPFVETKDQCEMNKVLEEFLDKLSEMKDWIDTNGYDNPTFGIFSIQTGYFLQKYVKFIPGHCPSGSKLHIFNLLSYAFLINSLKMAKHLLRSIKDDFSCIKSMILTINTFDVPVPKVFKQIAWQCKNPNAPDVFDITPLCYATKFSKLEIVEILSDICKTEFH